MSQPNMRYWIVGGEYEDAGFERLVRGTEKLVGPFANKANAEQAWREMSVATRSSCHTRFTIAEERAR